MCMYTWNYMCIYSTLAKQTERRKKKPNNPPSHETNKQTNNQRVGHRVPSLENWGGGLKIFCGMLTLPTRPVSKLAHIDKHRHIH